MFSSRVLLSNCPTRTVRTGRDDLQRDTLQRDTGFQPTCWLRRSSHLRGEQNHRAPRTGRKPVSHVSKVVPLRLPPCSVYPTGHPRPPRAVGVLDDAGLSDRWCVRRARLGSRFRGGQGATDATPPTTGNSPEHSNRRPARPRLRPLYPPAFHIARRPRSDDDYRARGRAVSLAEVASQAERTAAVLRGDRGGSWRPTRSPGRWPTGCRPWSAMPMRRGGDRPARAIRPTSRHSRRRRSAGRRSPTRRGLATRVGRLGRAARKALPAAYPTRRPWQQMQAAVSGDAGGAAGGRPAGGRDRRRGPADAGLGGAAAEPGADAPEPRRGSGQSA